MELYGYPRRTMPAVSAFAKTAVVFDNAVVPRGTTRPSYASMLTGLYPVHHGVRCNSVVLHEDNVTLPELLKGAGYHTAAFVSNGLMDEKLSGINQGFDVYVCDEGDGGSRTAKSMIPALLEWLDAGPPQPFFLFTNFIDPHGPYDPPERFRKRFRSQQTRMLTRDQIPPPIYVEGQLNHFDYVDRYDGDILYTDEFLGRAMAKLKDKGLWDEAFVVFTADHGECMGQHGRYYRHYPMVWEETMHVPLAIRLPGSVAKHNGISPGRVRGLCSPMDLPPTLLAYLGMSCDVKFDGRSLLPLMRGAGDDGRALLMEFPAFLRMRGIKPGVYGLRSATHKLIRLANETTGQTVRQVVFDLTTDRAEQAPIAFDPKLPVHRDLSGRLDPLLDHVRTYEPPFKPVVYERPSLAGRHPFLERKRKAGKIILKAMPKEQIERLRALGYLE